MIPITPGAVVAGLKIIGAMIIVIALIVAYKNFTGSFYRAGYAAATEACNKANTDRETQEHNYYVLKKHEVDLINKANEAKHEQAYKIYAKRIDDLRVNAVNTERLRINVKAAKCDRDSLSGSSQAGQGSDQQTERTYSTELSSEAYRGVSQVISEIEEMQALCQYAANIMP